MPPRRDPRDARGRNGNGNGRNGHRNRNGGVRAAGRRRERLRRDRARRTRRRLLLLIPVAVVLAGAASVVGGAFTGASAFRASCDLESLRPVTIGQNSFVYAVDGSLLGSIPAERNRQPLRLAQISRLMAEATVAIEDRRYYEHRGLDIPGIARAAVRNFEQGRIVEGGSTITQQLVRNLYVGNERSFERKLKEGCLALKIEAEGLRSWGPPPTDADERRAWTKARILETYLNQVYFGNHAYGIEAAAQTYFSKPASKLKLAEAAILAGLPQAPSVFDPFARPDEAVARRNDVLLAMRFANYITQEQYDRAVQARLKLKRGELYTKIREPYFFSYVREHLIAEYGVSMVRSGGLKVYTTIDPKYQRHARNAIKETLYERTDPASAIVSIDPKNGAIRAMTAVVPGRKKELQFNLAAQGKRQAGSAFKTFVLAEAIEEGINPDTTQYLSAPFRWQPDPTCSEAVDPNCVWEVETYDQSYVGATNISAATLRSDNTVYARLTLDVGPENVVDIARRMGVKTKLEPVASIGLGSNSVSVLEMASAYATLAAQGVYSKPMAIRKVVLANGDVDDEAGWGKAKRKRVLPDGVAYEVTRILEQNVQAGTGTNAAIGRPAAGKTGTTDNFADAWFCGYTPTLATAVWIGYPKAQVEMDNVHGIRVAGGTFPAMIWGDFMAAALAGVPITDWPYPSDPAIWLPFDGQYAFDGEVATETEEYDEPAPATTEDPTTSAPPPTTDAPPPPPPPTTTTPPPPTTSEPTETTTTE
ncbi:MAG: transglycosylase domain-containing protein [Actinobacteria bacterium]|nr:transglycosylase domain-containing protein [Actinomycetota bacterium]